MLFINKSYKDIANLLFPEYAEKFLLMTDTASKVRAEINKDIPNRTAFWGAQREFNRYLHAWQAATDDSYTQGNADARVYKALYPELYLRKQTTQRNNYTQETLEPFSCGSLGFSYIDDNNTMSAFSLVFDPEKRENWYLAVIKNPHQNVESREVFFLSGMENERNQSLIKKGYECKKLPLKDLSRVINSKRLEFLTKNGFDNNKVKPSVVLFNSFLSHGGYNSRILEDFIDANGKLLLDSTLLNIFFRKKPNAKLSIAMMRQLLNPHGVVVRFINSYLAGHKDRYGVLEKILLSDSLNNFLIHNSEDSLSEAHLLGFISGGSALKNVFKLLDDGCKAIEMELLEKLEKLHSAPLKGLTKGFEEATKNKLECYQQQVFEYKKNVKTSLVHFYASPNHAKEQAYKHLCNQVKTYERCLLKDALEIERYSPIYRKTKSILSNFFSHITLIGLAFNIYHYSKTERWFLYGKNESCTRACELSVDILSQANRAIKA